MGLIAHAWAAVDERSWMARMDRRAWMGAHAWARMHARSWTGTCCRYRKNLVSRAIERFAARLL